MLLCFIILVCSFQIDDCSGYSIRMYSTNNCSGIIVAEMFGIVSELFGSNVTVNECSYGRIMSCSAKDPSSSLERSYIEQRL